MTSEDILNYILNDSNDIKISIGIIKDGNTEYKVYKSNKIEETKLDYDYEIGSLSKTFVGLLISKAIKEEKLDLNDSISKYLDLKDNKYYPTIERLVTHTSGYKGYYFEGQMIRNNFSQNNDFYGINKEKILKKVRLINLKDQDYKFKYSNFGVSVLGLVLEKIYGMSFRVLMTDFINNELCLENTSVASCKGNLNNYWNWKDDDGYIPAGSIISNITSMARYLNMYLTSTKEYVNNVLNVLKKVDANNKIFEKMNIRIDGACLTWMKDNKNNIVWHNGGTSAYNSYIGFNKEKNIGIVILSNYPPNKKIPVTVLGIRMLIDIMK